MKGSISQKQLGEQFAEVDRRLSVVAFNPVNQKREITHGGLNALSALAAVADYTRRGFMVHICLDLPGKVGIIWDQTEFEIEAKPYFWKPEPRFGRKY